MILSIKKINGEKLFVMLVISGSKRFDNTKAKEVLEAKEIRFATEGEVEVLTQGVKPGGVRPFGNLFGIKVYVEKSLLVNEKIVFNAGDRRFSIGMLAKDYTELVHPQIVNLL